MTAVYDRRSGQTHLVAEPIAELLGLVANGGATVTELASRLDLGGDEAVLTDRLDELAAAGLIERR